MREHPDKNGRYWSADGVSSEEAGWRLARILYENMEHMDPGSGVTWQMLSHNERGFYHDAVLHLSDFKGLWELILVS